MAGVRDVAAALMLTERNLEAISLYGLVSAAMGVTVLWAAMRGGVPMPEESHGGAIHAIPAWVWAVCVIGQGFGTMIAVHCRWRVVLVAVALFGGLINIYLAVYAGDAIFGFLVARGAGVFGILHISIALAASLDVLRFAILKYGEKQNGR